MSEKTTKPTGSSMKVEEDSDIVQKRMEEAGYRFKTVAAVVDFADELLIDEEDSTSSSTTNGRKKRKDFIEVVVNGAQRFIPAEFIGGAKTSIKNGKNRKLSTKNTSKTKAKQDADHDRM